MSTQTRNLSKTEGELRKRYEELVRCGIAIFPNPCSYCHSKDNNSLINISLTMLKLMCSLKKDARKHSFHTLMLMEPLNFFLRGCTEVH